MNIFLGLTLMRSTYFSVIGKIFCFCLISQLSSSWKLGKGNSQRIFRSLRRYFILCWCCFLMELFEYTASAEPDVYKNKLLKISLHWNTFLRHTSHDVILLFKSLHAPLSVSQIFLSILATDRHEACCVNIYMNWNF